jgi:hypothetical protein
MADVPVVEVLDRREDLLDYFRSQLLRESPALNDVIKELATATELGHQVVVLLIDEHLIELDDVRMVHLLQDFKLIFEEGCAVGLGAMTEHESA